MPPLPPEIYLPIGGALVAGLVALFTTVMKAKNKHIKDVVDLTRESSEAAKAVALVLERIEELVRGTRRR